MSIQLVLLSTLLLAGCQTDTLHVADVAFVRQDLLLGTGEKNLMFADVNGDGHLDLLETSDGVLNVFAGDGKGGLSRLSTTSGGPDPTGFDVADIDGDGLADVVIANHETHFLTLLLGDGSGRFAAASNSPLSIDVDPHPHAVRALDLDRDGQQDLIVDHRNGGGLLIQWGLGEGAFDAPGDLIDTGGDPYLGFAIADLDGDGASDLVTPNPREVGVTMGTGPRSFARGVGVATSPPFGVDVADFDGDGVLDLIAASGESASDVYLYAGDGTGAFGRSLGRFAIARGGKLLTTGDLNGDGLADALVCSWSGEALAIMGGRGTLQTVRIQVSGNPWGLATGDLNEDGADDFVIADGVLGSAVLYLSVR